MTACAFTRLDCHIVGSFFSTITSGLYTASRAAYNLYHAVFSGHCPSLWGNPQRPHQPGAIRPLVDAVCGTTPETLPTFYLRHTLGDSSVWWTLIRSTPEATLPLICVYAFNPAWGRKPTVYRQTGGLLCPVPARIMKAPGGPYGRAGQALDSNAPPHLKEVSE